MSGAHLKKTHPSTLWGNSCIPMNGTHHGQSNPLLPPRPRCLPSCLPSLLNVGVKTLSHESLRLSLNDPLCVSMILCPPSLAILIISIKPNPIIGVGEGRPLFRNVFFFVRIYWLHLYALRSFVHYPTASLPLSVLGGLLVVVHPNTIRVFSPSSRRRYWRAGRTSSPSASAKCQSLHGETP